MAFCETLHLKIFPGKHAHRPSYGPSSYATCQADEHLPPPKKNFLTLRPMISHGMIKFGRANAPNTPPPPQQKDGSFAPGPIFSHAIASRAGFATV